VASVAATIDSVGQPYGATVKAIRYLEDAVARLCVRSSSFRRLANTLEEGSFAETRGRRAGDFRRGRRMTPLCVVCVKW